MWSSLQLLPFKVHLAKETFPANCFYQWSLFWTLCSFFLQNSYHSFGWVLSFQVVFYQISFIFLINWDLCLNISPWWWFVRVTLVLAFDFFQKFWQVVGTYESFYCHSMNAGSVVEIPRGGGDIQTLPYAKEFIGTYCTQRWWERKKFGHYLILF